MIRPKRGIPARPQIREAIASLLTPAGAVAARAPCRNCVALAHRTRGADVRERDRPLQVELGDRQDRLGRLSLQ